MYFIKLILQFEHQILAILLLALHALAWFTTSEALQLSIMPVLLGLFLLWQPVWNKEDSVRAGWMVIILLILFVFSYYYLFEALFLLCLLISGLIGSRLFSQNTTRQFDIIALAVLTIEMAIGIIPVAVDPVTLPAQFETSMRIFLLLPISLLFFAPIPERSSQQRDQIDLMHGLLAASLIFLALLGGIVMNLIYSVDYLEGLLLTVFIASIMTIGISWFWNPGVGYTGLGVLWNRYAMTIGGPFEVWINTLTTLIEEPYISPQEFLQAASDHLTEYDWLNGLQWELGQYSILSGEKKGNVVRHQLSSHDIASICFKSHPGQALRQHTLLLIRMAYQLYLAKLNQEKIRAEEHFETIHHTGARLTHDIKNILQSIKASLNIVQSGSNSQEALPSKLLQQNLTQISARLETTLDKLKAPELSTQIKLVNIRQWADSFVNQHKHNALQFRKAIEVERSIPHDLFDSVISNLLTNATRKADCSEIKIDIIANEDMTLVSVCDNGEIVPESVESQLFNKPVSSGEGMGIGLYQSAFMASTFNFELELASNQPGKVCFSLFQHLKD